MEFPKSIYLLVIGCLYFSLSQPVLPTLPSSFEVAIEITHLESNETTRTNEFYDAENGRVRIDIFDETGSYIEFWDLEEGAVHEITNFTNCTVRNMTSEEKNLYVNGSNIIGYSSVLQLAQGQNLTYLGEAAARSIQCDHWTTNTITETYGNVNATFVLEIWYSRLNWKISTGGYPWDPRVQEQIPIKVTQSGTFVHPNGSYPFTHEYNFVFYADGTPGPWNFDMLENWVCEEDEVILPNPGLPTLPDQFQTRIEITNAQTKNTASVYEYYDSINNRIREDYADEDEISTYILDINAGIQTSITGDDCTINYYNLSEGESIRNTSTLFNFGPGYNQTYQGQQTVRGIRCDWWTTRVVNQYPGVTANYTFRWYFSTTDWNMVTKSNYYRTPVQLAIRGVDTYTNGTTSRVEIYYNFVNWIPEAPSDEVFQADPNIACYSSLNVSFPPIPDSFTVTIEMTDLIGNRTQVMTEYYDYGHNTLRIDFWRDGIFSAVIYWLSDQVFYYFSDTIGLCYNQEYQMTDPYAMGNLTSFRSYFKLDNRTSYQGIQRVRGILSDHWAGHSHENDGNGTFTSETYHYYFSIENYDLASSLVQRLPVMMLSSGYRKNLTTNITTPFNYQYDFINFKGGDPDDFAFIPPDNWNCFQNPYNLYATFIIRVAETEFPFDNFTGHLATTIGVPSYFIRMLTQNPEGENKTAVMIEIGLADSITRDNLIETLERTGKTIVLNSSHYDGRVESLSIARQLSCPNGCIHGSCYFGQCVCDTGYKGVACETQITAIISDDGSLSSKPRALNAGEAAGIAVAFFVFGVIMGAVVFYFVFKRRVEEKTVKLSMIKMTDETSDKSSVDLN